MTMLAPEIFTVPFASGGNFAPLPLSTSTAVANQILGYPPIYATPYSAGGLPVDIGQTNGIFYSYSTQLVWQQGGGQFTYNTTWVTATGGYDAGIILWYATANQFVISLINGNNNNFITTPSLIDGTHWQYLSYYTNSNVVGDFKNSAQAANHVAGAGTWLICNGAVYNPATYPLLFVLIGTTFGGTSGSPLLPNLTDSVLAMSSGGHPNGTSTGSNSVAVVLPQHNHTITDSGHAHNLSIDSGGGSITGIVTNPSLTLGLVVSTSINTTGITINNTGTAGATMNVIQPTVYVKNTFIYAL